MKTNSRHRNWSLTKPNKRGIGRSIALLLLLPSAAWAGGVVTNCTEADLRAAMAGGGEVTFACDGTIVLANTISNTLDTVLDASGHQVTIIGSGRAFHVTGDVHFTVVNVTISGGSSSGGSAILNDGGTVNLMAVTFAGNEAKKMNEDADPVLPFWCVGGAVYNRSGALAGTNCTFVGNSAWSPAVFVGLGFGYPCGGAINNGGQLDLRSCSFVTNQASGGTPESWRSGDSASGGAIYNTGTATLDLCTFTGNSATGGNGSDVWDYPWALYSPGSEGGAADGGAIFSTGLLIVNRSTFCGNTATGGNGASGSLGDPNGSTLTGFVGGDGGNASGAAICGPAQITCCTLVSNVAIGGKGGDGGGGMIDAHWQQGGNGGTGGNGGDGFGGFSGTANLVNCTIAFNRGSGGAGGAGGGGCQANIQCGSGGTGGNGGIGVGGVAGTGLTNCTVAWNSGTGGSGGEAGAAGTSDVGRPGVRGTNGISGASWGGTSCSVLPNTLIASNTPSGGDSFTDPKLGPLADNGGPTLTMALLPGSPAIDAGDSFLAPATDQRGYPRCVGLATDIGAFEYAADVVPTVASLPASGVTGTQATLNGTVNPKGTSATAWFQWGTTTGYGNLTSATDLGSGSNDLPLLAPVAGLIPGKTYHFRVAAANSDGSVYGTDQVFTTPGPPQVWTLSATAVATNAVTLNGTVNPDGYPTAAWFEWGTTASYGNLTVATDTGSGTDALPLSVHLAGLTPGVIYHYRVTATNSNGAVYGSDQTFATLGPLQVWTMPATAIATNAATLNGTVNPKGNLTAAWFQWGTTTNYGNLTSVTDMGNGTNTLPLSVPLAGLAPDVTYHFRVAAINSTGKAYGSDQAFTTLGPPQVWTLSATADTTGAATLNGTVNPKGSPTAAWFQWGTTTSYGYLTPMTDMGSGTNALPLSVLLAGLDPGVTYHFRIAATNSAGEVHGTDQAFATLGPPQVWTLSATAVTTEGATLNGSINPDGYPTAAWFQWGTSTSYGYVTPVADMGNGTTSLPLSVRLAGLTPGVTYHFRVAATDSNATAYGSDQVFTTSLYSVVPSNVDPTFNANPSFQGRNNDAAMQTIWAINLQKDGKLLIGGKFRVSNSPQFVGIARLNPDGSLDNSFLCATDFVVYAIVVQPDGKILIAGNPFDPEDLYFTRLNPDGSFDESFLGGQGGVVGGSRAPRALALQVDGKVLLGGMFGSVNGFPQAGLARLNGDGSLDTTFTPGLYHSCLVGSIAVQPDGKILFGGDFNSVNGVLRHGIARLNPDGTLDAFNPTIMPDTSDRSVKLFLQPDGRILVYGTFYEVNGVSCKFVVRLNPDGSLDSSFMPDPLIVSVRGPNALAVQYDGKILLGKSWPPTNNLARLNADGSLDKSFLVSATEAGSSPSFHAIAQQPDGKILAAGWFTSVEGVSRTNIVRLMGDYAPLSVLGPPCSMTVEQGASASFTVTASAYLAPEYQWFFNGTNVLPGSTSWCLELASAQPSDCGAYTVVVTNAAGAITSGPAMLNVIPPVGRRCVPGIQLMAEAGSLLNVDTADSLSPSPNWTALGSVVLTSTPQYYFDVSAPLPPHRYYRAWQTGAPSGPPSLSMFGIVPAITLTGNIGDSVRVDAINQFGPIDAWFTLDTVTLTNTSQLYFDPSAPGQPERLYRLVPIP